MIDIEIPDLLPLNNDSEEEIKAINYLSKNRKESTSIYTLEYINKITPEYSYPFLVRKCLDNIRRNFNYAYKFPGVLALNDYKLDKKSKDFLEELYSKIPTRNSIFKEYLCKRIIRCLDFIWEPLEQSEKDKYKKILENYCNNTVKVKEFDNKFIFKLIWVFRCYIFNFDTLQNILTSMYWSNRDSYIAEKSVCNFLQNSYTILDTPTFEDINHGVDIIVEKKSDNRIVKFQVKRVFNINISEPTDKFKNTVIWLNNTNIEIENIDKKDNYHFDWLVLVLDDKLIFIDKKEIISIKSVKNRNDYGITCNTYNLYNYVTDFSTEVSELDSKFIRI